MRSKFNHLGQFLMFVVLTFGMTNVKGQLDFEFSCRQTTVLPPGTQARELNASFVLREADANDPTASVVWVPMRAQGILPSAYWAFYRVDKQGTLINTSGMTINIGSPAIPLDEVDNAKIIGTSDGGYFLSGNVKYGTEKAAIILKLDQAYNRMWGFRLRNPYFPSSEYRFFDVKEDLYGNLVLVGQAEDMSLHKGILVSKFDPVGRHVWSSFIDGDSDTEAGLSINTAAADQILVTGFTRSSCSGAGISLEPQFFAVSLDNNGNTMWSKKYLHSEPGVNTVANCIIYSPRNVWNGTSNTIVPEYAICGYYLRTQSSHKNVLYARIDAATGNLQFHRMYSSLGQFNEEAFDMYEDGNTNFIHIGGYTSSFSQRDALYMVIKQGGTFVDAKINLTPYDEFANEIHATLGGSLMMVNRIFAGTPVNGFQTSNNFWGASDLLSGTGSNTCGSSLILSSSFENIATFDFVQGNPFLEPIYGDEVLFDPLSFDAQENICIPATVTIEPNLSNISERTPVQENTISSTKVSIYPNPAQNSLYVSGNENDNYQIQIIDVVGKMVKSQTFEGGSQIKVSLEGLEKGIYFVNIVNEQNMIIHTDKLIKQ